MGLENKIVASSEEYKGFPSKSWNYSGVRDYLLAISRGYEFLLPINQYPEKIQLSKPWHELFNQMRKESRDTKERYALAGYKDDLQNLYLPKTPALGDNKCISDEVQLKERERTQRAGITGIVGDIHSHQNGFWNRMGGRADRIAKLASMFSNGDFYGLLDKDSGIKFRGLAEKDRNFLVFRSQETEFDSSSMNWNEFINYWDYPTCARRAMVGGEFTRLLKRDGLMLRGATLQVNIQISNEYELAIYSGKPNEDFEKIIG